MCENVLDDLQPNDIWYTISLYKKASKNQKHNISQKIIAEINKLDKKCMCNMIKQINSYCISEEILYAFLHKCKKSCNFCKITYMNKLQIEYADKLSIPYYLKLFNFDDLIQNTTVINILVHKSGLSYQQLYKIIVENDKIIFPESIVTNIIYAFLESKFDIEKLPFRILSHMLKKENFIDVYSSLFCSLVVELARHDKINIFDEKNITLFTSNDVVINYALKHCSIEQIEKLINQCNALSINYSNFYDIYYKFNSTSAEKIVSKMINVFSYISYCSNKMNNTTVNLVVKSSDIINSIVDLNGLEVYEDLCSQTKIFVNYLGEVGYDASGLKKDFFSNCALEFSNLLDECDGYLIIPITFSMTKMQIKYISLMLARSMFVENISPQIRLHPLLTYLLISGGKCIEFSKFRKYMSHFKIDFFDNIFKLLNLTNSDYQNFTSLQDDLHISSMTREKYILTTISKKYIHPKLIEFVNSFRIFLKSLYFVDYVNPNIFHKYMCGNDNYEIVGNTTHCLKQNLNVIGTNPQYVNMFKKVFLDILENINNISIIKLQMFLKYWFATSSIISFSDRSPIIYIDTCKSYNVNSKFNCFYSSTCFDKLSIMIAIKEFLNEFTLKSFIEEAIDSSIENQKVWESVGVHMQLA
jgi:hypothetical protein